MTNEMPVVFTLDGEVVCLGPAGYEHYGLSAVLHETGNGVLGGYCHGQNGKASGCPYGFGHRFNGWSEVGWKRNEYRMMDSWEE